MKPKRTPEEIALIRPAFNSNGKLGLIEMVVRTAHERHPSKVLYFDDLVSRYTRLECAGVLKLIDFLTDEKERNLTQLGSGSIDFAGVISGEFSMEAAMSLQEIYIGNPKLGITPLQWLFYLSEGLGKLKPEQIKAFDDFCGEIARIEEVIKNGDYKEVDFI